MYHAGRTWRSYVLQEHCAGFVMREAFQALDLAGLPGESNSSADFTSELKIPVNSLLTRIQAAFWFGSNSGWLHRRFSDLIGRFCHSPLTRSGKLTLFSVHSYCCYNAFDA